MTLRAGSHQPAPDSVNDQPGLAWQRADRPPRRLPRGTCRRGVGLIITEGIRVDPASAARDTALGAFTDAAIPAYAAMADAVHQKGAAMFAQLLHLGRQAAGEFSRTGPAPWLTRRNDTHVPRRAAAAAA